LSSYSSPAHPPFGETGNPWFDEPAACAQLNADHDDMSR